MVVGQLLITPPVEICIRQLSLCVVRVCQRQLRLAYVYLTQIAELKNFTMLDIT